MPIQRPGFNHYVPRHGVGASIRVHPGTFKRYVTSAVKGGGWPKPKPRAPRSETTEFERVVRHQAKKAAYMAWKAQQEQGDNG